VSVEGETEEEGYVCAFGSFVFLAGGKTRIWRCGLTFEKLN